MLISKRRKRKEESYFKILKGKQNQQTVREHGSLNDKNTTKQLDYDGLNIFDLNTVDCAFKAQFSIQKDESCSKMVLSAEESVV